MISANEAKKISKSNDYESSIEKEVIFIIEKEINDLIEKSTARGCYWICFNLEEKWDMEVFNKTISPKLKQLGYDVITVYDNVDDIYEITIKWD